MQLQNIEKKTLYNWLLKRTIWVLVFYAITHLYLAFFDRNEDFSLWLSLLIIICMLDAFVVIYAYVMPWLQYPRYKYAIRDDEVYLEYGVIFKHTTYLPIVQLQDVGYTEGPIQMLMGLATLHVSTAGSDLVIEGLKKSTAVELVDVLNKKAKELVLAKKQGESDEV